MIAGKGDTTGITASCCKRIANPAAAQDTARGLGAARGLMPHDHCAVQSLQHGHGRRRRRPGNFMHSGFVAVLWLPTLERLESCEDCLDARLPGKYKGQQRERRGV